jgi:predicted SnoaL-like aldol condensation-catalyzing enzyme
MSATSPSLSLSEQNKQLVVRWFNEVWNQGRRETIFELLSPDSILHDGPQEYRGPDEFARFHDVLRQQFSNFDIQPVQAVAEDDRVAMHWICSMTHTQSQKPLRITGSSIVRIENGRFVEAWQNWDAAHLHSQLTGQSILPL